MGNEAQNFLPELAGQDGPQPGPSWARKGWPLVDADADLTQAMDPTAMAVAIQKSAEKSGKALLPR